MKNLLHEKEDFIIHNKKYYRCICADKELAVFARVTPHRKDDGYKTTFKELFVVGQEKSTTLLDYHRFYRGEFTPTFPTAKNMKGKSRGYTSGVEAMGHTKIRKPSKKAA